MSDHTTRYPRAPRYSRLHGYLFIGGVVAIVGGFVAFLFLAESNYDVESGSTGLSVSGTENLLDAVGETISGTVGE
ncbi:hypothetical protein [Yoonia sp. 208BN28-4]|uniref:hypothetical protein n=1 Tax=Yoonia sp. 208BN28-4 TaxID=3126505 RepID=UPI0030B3DA30